MSLSEFLMRDRVNHPRGLCDEGDEDFARRQTTVPRKAEA